MTLFRGYHASKLLTTLAVILVASALLTQLVSPVDNAEAPKYGGVLVMELKGDPATFNQGITTAPYTHLAGSVMFDSLIIFDFNWNPKPKLAESWEISADGLTYTFHLVENATWHDGEPFTSADVKWNIEELYYKNHPAGKVAFECIDHVETPDTHTAILKLKYSFPALMPYLSPWTLMLLPKHLYEGTDILTNPHNLDDPIGTGPFKFVEFVKGDHITFVRNPNYWRKGQPYLDKVVFRIIPDSSTQAIAFEKGEIDVIWPIDIDLVRIPDWEDTPGIIIKNVGGGAYGPVDPIFINLRSAPLNNTLVRQAITHAIDKETAVTLATYGLYKPGTSPIPTSLTLYYNPDVPKYEYDPTKAEQLLDQAGYPRGIDGKRFKISLMYNTGPPGIIAACELIREYFGDVGIELELKPTDQATAYEYAFSRYDFDLIYVAGFVTSPEPSIAVGRLYHSNQIKPGLFNAAGYNNSRVDELFDLASTEPDQEIRAEYYKEIQMILVTDLPTIWLWEKPYVWAYHDKWVEGSGPFNQTVPADLHWYSGFDYLQWKEGSEVSPESAQADIDKAEDTIEALKSQFYDVSESMRILEEAKAALAALDYATASNLAEEAIAAAIPPYWLYATVAVVVAALVIGGYIYVRRRRRPT